MGEVLYLYFKKTLFLNAKRWAVLPCIVSLLTGCGKKFTQQESDQNNKKNENLLVTNFMLTSSLMPDMAESYTLPNHIYLTIPGGIEVILGDSQNVVIETTFQFEDSRQDFYCLFTGNQNPHYPIGFSDCYVPNPLNRAQDFSLNYHPGDEVLIDKNTQITQRVKSGLQGFPLKVNGEYEIRWY